MELFDAIETRHCKRAFLDTPIHRDHLNHVLHLAGQAPSSKNTQPWEVAIVSGDTRTQLSQRLCEAFDRGDAGEPDYVYSPHPLPDEHMDRARACGYGLFELKGIERQDHEARRLHARENLTFFNAPAVLIVHVPSGSERGTFLDVGLFLQNVMLGLLNYNMASCPQYSIACYAQPIRELLGLQDRWIVCGMSIGYPDPENPVNSYRPNRLLLDQYTQWYD